MPGKPILEPARVSRQFVESKCDYFSSIHLWPRETKVNPSAWLSNFRESEMDHAVHLLGAFLYYSADLTIELFKAAFHSLSARLGDFRASHADAKSAWLEFRNSLIVTRVTGEVPNDTDSGYAFARMARQQLNLDESQIMSNREAIQFILDHGPTPVVFVDDFVGSGDQFITTWERDIEIVGGNSASFKKLSRIGGSVYCYCPLFIVEMGRTALSRECPDVRLSPAHYIPTNYSALSDDSIVWPDHLRPTALEFLQTASRRAGVNDPEWMGYRGQGLTLAFEHGVPDATLPIFYSCEGEWKPLIRRT
jgi:hypothetical protein